MSRWGSTLLIVVKKKKYEARTSVFGPQKPACVMVLVLASQNVKIVVVGGVLKVRGGS